MGSGDPEATGTRLGFGPFVQSEIIGGILTGLIAQVNESMVVMVTQVVEVFKLMTEIVNDRNG